MESLGRRLLKARTAKGYTQVELAHKLGEYQSKYRGWESDKYEPNIDTLKALAVALDVTVEWLVSGIEPTIVKEDGVKYISTPQGSVPHDPITKELVRIMNTLLDQQKTIYSPSNSTIRHPSFFS